MKNKKLFAILTLVCFMFTLMPVAAFAADTYAQVAEEDAYINVGSDATLTISGADTSGTTTYAVYAYKNGAFDKDFGFKTLAYGANEVTFTKAGSYELHVVNNVANAPGVYTVSGATLTIDSAVTNADAIALLEDKSTMTMLDNVVVVSPGGAVPYNITVQTNGNIVGSDVVTNDGYSITGLGADSAFTEQDVWVKLDAGGTPVVGATLTIDTNSSAVSVDKTEVKTNGAGMAKFTVSASTAGNFKIYVNFGTRATEVISVGTTALAPANVKTVAEPTAPFALYSDLKDANIRFSVTDANGNSVAIASLDNTPTTGNYKVVVTEKPVGATIVGANVELYQTATGLGLRGDAAAALALTKEGNYTFKVVLDNGAYATASLTVKEFQTPVALKVTYPADAVELGGTITATSVNFVDANGVTRAALPSEVELSASGYAVSNFTDYVASPEAWGKIDVESDEKYVGSTIKVIAVSDRYDLVATTELTVANEAVAVKYATTNAEVGVNNTLVANIVDVDGNKVALKPTIGAAASEIKYIVLDKPADAKVAISTVGTSNTSNGLDIAKGQFKVSFTASKAGEYKVQTVVRYEQASGVVKYYSGIETITVGDSNAFDNIVVISMGANSMIVNDELVKLDVAPFIENNRTMLQYNVLWAFGIDVEWDGVNSVIAEGNGIKVVMTIGEKVAVVNGEEVALDVAPYVVNGRTVVPVGLITGVFDIDYAFTYNADGSIADILFTK